MDYFKCSTSTHLFTLVWLHSVPWFPLSLSVVYLTYVNGIHQWLVIRWWNTMFNLDTSIYIVGYVLAVVCVEEFLDWWHFIYATSLIMPVFMIFELSWLDSSVCQISSAIMEILIHSISSSFMDILVLCMSSSWRFWSIIYCTWRWPHM